MAKLIKNVIILLIIIFILSGCTNLSIKKQPDITEKLDAEINYLDVELIALINNLNNIVYSNYKITVTEVKENSSNTGNSSESESSSSSGTSSGSSKSSTDTQSSSGETSQITTEQTVKTFEMTPSTSLESTSEIDWTKIKSNVEILSSSWVTVAIDLKSAGIPEEKVKEFNSKLDELIISIKNEKDTESIQKIVEAHALLYQYVEIYDGDSNYKKILQTKNKIISSFNNAMTNNWEKANTDLDEAADIFRIIVDNPGGDENKKVNIERCAVLIKEEKICCAFEEKSVFLMKYKNLIQEINIL